MDTFTETFVNWIFLHAAGLIASLAILNLFLKRRHSYAVWAIYFGIRAVVRSYASALIITGKMTPTLMNLYMAFIIITAFMNFVVLYYVWDDEPLKVCSIGILSDIICGSAMVLGAYISNLVTKNSMTPSISEFNGLSTVIDFAVIMAVVWCMRFILKPVAVWFRNFEFRHRRIAAAAIIIGISLFSSTNVTENAGFNSSTIMVCALNSLMLLPVGIYAIKELHSQRDRKALLKQQAAMTSAYILAVDRQSESLSGYRELLDTIRGRIEASEQKLKQEQLRAYVSELRDYADQLRSGKYSDSLILDAGLSAFAGKFEETGYAVDFRADGLTNRTETEQRAGEITWIILNWVLQAVKADSAAETNKNNNNNQDRSIQYRIMTSGNQIMFRMHASGLRGRRFPERMLREHISRRDFVNQSIGRRSVELCIMKEEDAWER